MSFLNRLRRNIGVEEAEQDKESDEIEEEEIEIPKAKKKITVKSHKKSKPAQKEIKKTEKKKKPKKEEEEIEDEDENDEEDELGEEELDDEAEKELEKLLEDEEYDDDEDEDEEEYEEDEEKKISQTKRTDFSLKKLAGPEGELAVDVYQTAKDIVIEAAIAGVDPDELEVYIESDTVIIKGARGECAQDKDKSYFYQECYWGAFQRRIILPEEVDAARGKAELKKGILCIRIPKTERKKRRKIDVKE